MGQRFPQLVATRPCFIPESRQHEWPDQDESGDYACFIPDPSEPAKPKKQKPAKQKVSTAAFTPEVEDDGASDN